MLKVPAIRVIDTDFNYYAHIGNYESLWFERKLWEVGNFEIRINLSKPGANELKEGRIIILDEKRAGVINYINTKTGSKGAELVAKGTQLKGILKSRLTVPGQKSESEYFGYDRFPYIEEGGTGPTDAPAESVIKHYVENHAVNPENASRKFPRLVIAEDQKRGLEMRWSSRFESLDAVLKEIGEWSGMGYDIYIDFGNEQFVFDVIPLTDHTSGSDNPVLFSVDFGNLDSLEYCLDETNWSNAGYAGGSGEDEGRLIHTVYENDVISSGFLRHETFLDCGNIDDIEDLIYEGKYKLKDKERAETANGVIIPSGPFEYMKNYDIGDRVTAQSKKQMVEFDTQITATKEAYEANKISLTATFGGRQKNFLDEIRKTGVVR